MFREQITRIKDKFTKLKDGDKDFQIFGADSHNYELNSVLKASEIQQFEKFYNIFLPKEYERFVLEIGDGGAGPFYGIEKLKNSIYESLDYKNEENKVNPSLSFPFNKPWNLDRENYENLEEFEKEYFDSKYSNGLIRLCNFGCGIYINLVVNGEEYGNMWTDDRCNDGGVYPSVELDNKKKLNFLDWYELWLDKSLEELKIYE